jgi:hypothetical protein
MRPSGNERGAILGMALCLHNYDKELMQETIGAAVEGCPATTNNNIGKSAPSHCGVCGSILPKSILFLKSQHLLVFRSSARALY